MQDTALLVLLFVWAAIIRLQSFVLQHAVVQSSATWWLCHQSGWSNCYAYRVIL